MNRHMEIDRLTLKLYFYRQLVKWNLAVTDYNFNYHRLVALQSTVSFFIDKIECV